MCGTGRPVSSMASISASIHSVLVGKLTLISSDRIRATAKRLYSIIAEKVRWCKTLTFGKGLSRVR